MISIFLLEPGSHHHRLTQMICCMMAQRGLYTALVYLDDVLINNPTQPKLSAKQLLTPCLTYESESLSSLSTGPKLSTLPNV